MLSSNPSIGSEKVRGNRQLESLRIVMRGTGKCMTELSSLALRLNAAHCIDKRKTQIWANYQGKVHAELARSVGRHTSCAYLLTMFPVYR